MNIRFLVYGRPVFLSMGALLAAKLGVRSRLSTRRKRIHGRIRGIRDPSVCVYLGRLGGHPQQFPTHGLMEF